MGRAYTAKPVVVPEVDYPPGWNISWPYPGAYPPGYTPSYDATLTIPEYVRPNSPTANANVSFVLADQVEYITSEPKNNSITWTSSSPYTGGPSGGYAEDDDSYWWDNGTFIFQGISPGDIIVVSATSEPFDDWPITKSANILVVTNEEKTETTDWYIEVAVESVVTSASETHTDGEVSSSAYSLTSIEALIDNCNSSNYTSLYSYAIADSLYGNESDTETETQGENYSVTGEYVLRRINLPSDFEEIVTLTAWAEANALSRVDAPASASSTASCTFTIKVYNGESLEAEHEGALSASSSVSVSGDDYAENEDESTYGIGFAFHGDKLYVNLQ